MATKSPDNSPKISWWEYQKGEKWFLFAFLFIVAGAIGVFWLDGGIVLGALFGSAALLLGVLGGVFKWLEYKRGGNS